MRMVRRIPSPHGRLVSFAANELHFEAAIKANYNLSRWISDKTVISRVAPLVGTKFKKKKEKNEKNISFVNHFTRVEHWFGLWFWSVARWLEADTPSL